MKHFVPADQGDSGHEAILRDFAGILPELEQKLRRRGIPGVFLDLEPHLKGGGQFGGFSGPDGMGVALRALCKVLDYVGIDYHLRDFDDIRAARGFWRIRRRVTQRTCRALPTLLDRRELYRGWDHLQPVRIEQTRLTSTTNKPKALGQSQSHQAKPATTPNTCGQRLRRASDTRRRLPTRQATTSRPRPQAATNRPHQESDARAW